MAGACAIIIPSTIARNNLRAIFPLQASSSISSLTQSLSVSSRRFHNQNHNKNHFSPSTVHQQRQLVFQLQFKTSQVQSNSLISSPLSSKRFTSKTNSSSSPSLSPFFLSSRNFSSKITIKNSFGNFVMAAASVAISKGYSTAVVQPQFDSIDETVDPVQRELLAEQCIVLNDEDKVIGHDTKRNCHRIVKGDVLLHRAFSVFLFNGKDELLLQQRSKTKITFPLLWTNTCCSHPLYTPSELEEKNALGVRRAARRRLEIELGIPQDSISLDDFKYLTRIHYKALSNSIWGEHEIDYILFLQKDNLEIKPNPDEIQEIRWVKLDKVKDMIVKENANLTPWFELILNSRLPEWWNNLDKLKQFEDHKKIHKM